MAQARLGRPGGTRERADSNTDPLGRPRHGRDLGDDASVKVPGEIDVQRERLGSYRSAKTPYETTQDRDPFIAGDAFC